MLAMLSLMYGFYSKYAGYVGYNEIIAKSFEIQNLQNQVNSTGLLQFEKHIEIMHCESVINNISEIRKFGNFSNYLGGEGCILSVDGLEGIIERSPYDCFYKGIIPPSKIKVVNIMDECTKECFNDREKVLTYLTYLYSLDKIIKNVPEKNINDVYLLYQYIHEFNFQYCNQSNYILKEIPISFYNYPKEKTLTIC